MRIALVLVVPDIPRTQEAHDVVAEQVRYHIAQGADVVVGVADETGGELFAGLGRERRFRYVVAAAPAAVEDTQRARQVAAEQHRADWLLESEAGEFWWPRRGTLRVFLDAVPARFDAVRALEREFAAQPGNGDSFFERATVRRRRLPGAAATPPPRLRTVYRASAALDREQALPLHDWYPLELLRFPLEQRDPLGDEELAAGLAEGSLRADTRIRDALRGEPLATPTPVEEAELAEELELALASERESLFPAVEDLDRRLVALERTGLLAPAAELRRLIGSRRRTNR
jgi:hypothetical protein